MHLRGVFGLLVSAQFLRVAVRILLMYGLACKEAEMQAATAAKAASHLK